MRENYFNIHRNILVISLILLLILGLFDFFLINRYSNNNYYSIELSGRDFENPKDDTVEVFTSLRPSATPEIMPNNGVSSDAIVEATSTSEILVLVPGEANGEFPTATPGQHVPEAGSGEGSSIRGSAAYIEVEWPSLMEYRHADTLRILILYNPSLTKQIRDIQIEVGGKAVELEEKSLIITPSVKFQEGLDTDYQTYASAEISGQGFEFDSSKQEFKLEVNKQIIWEWNILPIEEGLHVLNARIDLIWLPQGESVGEDFGRLIWLEQYEIEVEKPFVLRGQIRVWEIIFGGVSLTSLYYVAKGFWSKD